MIYDLYKDQMETGDVILWSSKSLLGAGIRFFSKADVNHASLVVRIRQYEQDQRYIAEAVERGVVLARLSKRLTEYDGTVWWLPLAAPRNEQEIGTRALFYQGVEYDYGSFIKQAVARVSINARRLFCSELVAVCLGYEKGTAPRPGDLEGLGIFEPRTLIYRS